MRNFEIRTFQFEDIDKAVELSDLVFGPGYYTRVELEKAIQNSSRNNQQMSVAGFRGDQLIGVRLSYPPGKWNQGRGVELSTDQWPQAIGDTAYFQSIFVHPAHRRDGLARELSLESLRRLKASGCKGVAAHAWVESPGDGARKYLLKLGFKKIATYKSYWSEVDYMCTGCQTKPCLCTAEEMYLDLTDN